MRFEFRAALIVRQDDRVLLHRARGDDFWTLPGGRVEPGETPVEAVQREIYEELGVDVVCGRLVAETRHVFTHANRTVSQQGRYFAGILPADWWGTHCARPFTGIEPGRELEFAWFPLSALEGVLLRPDFLLRLLKHEDENVDQVLQLDFVTPSR